ncbi:unnamed protein product [Protopolystoma xenopodis]|uniref:Uncharacterized protein n=1 Tax=Protopolystoma xenopodis TaxID=117903 RepID=A0A3S5FCD2_9PLAT|nr:unnamed protein product [Protopolystoma xenopodis]
MPINAVYRSSRRKSPCTLSNINSRSRSVESGTVIPNTTTGTITLAAFSSSKSGSISPSPSQTSDDAASYCSPETTMPPYPSDKTQNSRMMHAGKLVPELTSEPEAFQTATGPSRNLRYGSEQTNTLIRTKPGELEMLPLYKVCCKLGSTF